MISKGVPSPLGDALAQVGKWTVERDSARARLKELGYRARFRERVAPRARRPDSGRKGSGTTVTARQLLQLYPRAWRERYGEEFAEIVG